MGIFGTDGVRGRAGEGVLSLGSVRRISHCFAQVLREERPNSPLEVAICRDTRLSGPDLAEAVADGLVAVGIEVVDLGVLPTPALALYLSHDMKLAGGVMITASHNAWQDNGLKLFGRGGTKVSDRVQERCEELFQSDLTCSEGAGLQATRNQHQEAKKAYLASLAGLTEFLFSQGTSVVDRPLAGRVVVADAAAGAAHGVLAPALMFLGAEVITHDPAPNGKNINDGCGAVDTGSLERRVVAEGAWAGLAVDGDGDRILLVDEQGAAHDGDVILGFLAGHMLSAGVLRGEQVVGTVTTGLGLEQYLSGLGLSLRRTAVGDRHVAQAMAEDGCNLGGESSGHVLTPDLCPSGDGTRVGLWALTLAAGAPGSISQQFSVIPRFPVENRKVQAKAKPPLSSLPSLVKVQEQAKHALAAANGRVLLRYSGTEPVLRIRVEAEDDDAASYWADRLANSASEAISNHKAV